MNGSAEILILEDNPADMKLLLHAIRLHGINAQCSVVRDGEEALDFLFCRGAYAARSRLERPRLTLLDLKVPKVDGFQVLAAIRKDPATRLMPVVVLTSSSQTEDVNRCYELGANSYVQKPVEFEALSEAVRTIAAYWLSFNLPPGEQTA
jgi:two-component system response regulator